MAIQIWALSEHASNSQREPAKKDAFEKKSRLFRLRSADHTFRKFRKVSTKLSRLVEATQKKIRFIHQRLAFIWIKLIWIIIWGKQLTSQSQRFWKSGRARRPKLRVCNWESRKEEEEPRCLWAVAPIERRLVTSWDGRQAFFGSSNWDVQDTKKIIHCAAPVIDFKTLNDFLVRCGSGRSSVSIVTHRRVASFTASSVPHNSGCANKALIYTYTRAEFSWISKMQILLVDSKS